MTDFAWNFPQASKIVCSSYFSINAPLLYCPLFSRKNPNHQVGSNKMETITLITTNLSFQF